MKKPAEYYASEPAVPRKKIAGTNPVGSVALGAMKSPTVPDKPGANRAFGPQVEQFHHPHIRGSHGYGHPPAARHGHLRYSSDPKAHRFGGGKKLIPGT